MEALDIQAFTFEDRYGLLQHLPSALARCGAWVTERQTSSIDSIEFQLEIRLRMSLDVYSAIVGSGIELTRAGHDVLTDLCTVRKHTPLSSELGQLVGLRLHVRFLDEISLLSLLPSVQIPS